MEKPRILVVDDERDLCEILRYNLSASGYDVEVAFTAEDALQARPATFDLFLLDVMLPGMSGFDLARRLKSDGRTARVPVIFLTAKDSEEDLLHGFGLGADDYVKKPFSVREVLARVKVVLGRSVAAQVSPRPAATAQIGIDRDRKSVLVGDDEVLLTPTEFALLDLLLSHPGQVFSRQQLMRGAWPDKVVVTERAIDVNITRLRKKLGPYGQLIVARQGFGYLFEPPLTSV